MVNMPRTLKTNPDIEQALRRSVAARIRHAGRRPHPLAARRRRMRFAWKVPPRQVLLAFHDRARDRLVVGQGPDAERVNLLLQGIGWRGRFGTMDTADGTSIVELGQR